MSTLPDPGGHGERSQRLAQEATQGLRQVARDNWRAVARICRDYLGDEAEALKAEREADRLAADLADDDADAM